MFSPTTTKKISIFQMPPPRRGGIQITPDLQNINILSFSNFLDVNLIDSHPKNTLPQKRAVFMVRNFSTPNHGLGLKSTLKTKTCRFSFKQFFGCPPLVYRVFEVPYLRCTMSSRYRIFGVPCLRGTVSSRYRIFEVPYLRGTVSSRYRIFEVPCLRCTMYSRVVTL